MSRLSVHLSPETLKWVQKTASADGRPASNYIAKLVEEARRNDGATVRDLSALDEAERFNQVRLRSDGAIERNEV